MTPLTRQQQGLLNYIRSCERAPSFDEMRIAMGLKSKSGIHRLVTALVDRGYIRRIPNRARCIELVASPHLPPVGISATPLLELAREALRRGFVLGHYQHDTFKSGDTWVERKQFVELRP